MSLDRKIAAGVLQEAAALLEVQGENVYRIRALANASRIVERIEGDLEALVESGEILEIKGVGKGTAAILKQLIAGEHPEILAEAEKAIPAGVREMLEIPGLGPRKVRALWQDLGLVGIGELEYACRENRLVELPGFGAKTQKKLVGAIRFARMAGRRRLINEAWNDATDIASSVRGFDGVAKVVVGGEVRRWCETVGLLEFVVTADEEGRVGDALSDFFPEIEAEEPFRFSGLTESGLPMTLRVVSAARAAAAILWSTGSDGHLRALVEHAESAGLRLDERGLWRGDARVECADERAVYEALGCQWVAPELREGEGEVERAVAGTLPELVVPEDLLGVLHNHTTDSDGAASLEEMAAAARDQGWSFFGVADHSPVASYANGVSAGRLRDQWRRIDELNATMPGFRVVKGIEADILTDGSLDIPEGCEEGLEYVVASVHSAFHLAEEVQTERLVRAVSHPACRILGHPTGRLLLGRKPGDFDVEALLDACAESGCAIELNANPARLDLAAEHLGAAKERGVLVSISADAHSIQEIRIWITASRWRGAQASPWTTCSTVVHSRRCALG